MYEEARPHVNWERDRKMKKNKVVISSEYTTVSEFKPFFGSRSCFEVFWLYVTSDCDGISLLIMSNYNPVVQYEDVSLP